MEEEDEFFEEEDEFFEEEEYWGPIHCDVCSAEYHSDEQEILYCEDPEPEEVKRGVFAKFPNICRKCCKERALDEKYCNFIECSTFNENFFEYKGDYIDVKDNILSLNNKNISNLQNLKGFDNIKNLKILDLTENQITEIKLPQNLHTLKVLYLGKNRVCDTTGLKNFSNLRTLRLEENKITNITNVSGLDCLTQLEDLNLSKNEISKLDGIENLINLKQRNRKEHT